MIKTPNKYGLRSRYPASKRWLSSYRQAKSNTNTYNQRTQTLELRSRSRENESRRQSSMHAEDTEQGRRGESTRNPTLAQTLARLNVSNA
eukprot:c23133_g1_i1 orf=784-1053(+)